MAFGCGFYILLNQHQSRAMNHTTCRPPGHGNYNTGDEATVAENVFNYFWKGLVKTSIMFVGEIEFSSFLELFDKTHGDCEDGAIPKTMTYFFFLSFVVLIVIVLANLLNGLAVADIRDISGKAEVYTYISRLETIYLHEYAVVNGFKVLTTILKKMGFLSQQVQARAPFVYRMTGIDKTLLFAKKDGLYYNYKKEPVKAFDMFFSSSQMDKNIIDSAKKVIAANHGKHVEKKEDPISSSKAKNHEKLDQMSNNDLCQLVFELQAELENLRGVLSNIITVAQPHTAQGRASTPNSSKSFNAQL